MKQLHDEKALARLNHIEADLDGGTFAPERIARMNTRIVDNEDNAPTCIGRLKSYAVAKAMSSWFKSGNLTELKNWFYVAGKLEFVLTEAPFNFADPSAYVDRALDGMFFLVADHQEMIRWYSKFDEQFDTSETDDPKAVEFWTKQFFVALRGDWDTLASRCEDIFNAPPTTGNEKKFMIDHKFYLALAKGDVAGMEGAIKELVTKKLLSSRSSLEGGYTEYLICTPAIIYSKLAWLHGYEIVVDTPYIPKEWLPRAPLASYDDQFNFMKNYKIP